MTRRRDVERLPESRTAGDASVDTLSSPHAAARFVRICCRPGWTPGIKDVEPDLLGNVKISAVSPLEAARVSPIVRGFHRETASADP